MPGASSLPGSNINRIGKYFYALCSNIWILLLYLPICHVRTHPGMQLGGEVLPKGKSVPAIKIAAPAIFGAIPFLNKRENFSYYVSEIRVIWRKISVLDHVFRVLPVYQVQ